MGVDVHAQLLAEQAHVLLPDAKKRNELLGRVTRKTSVATFAVVVSMVCVYPSRASASRVVAMSRYTSSTARARKLPSSIIL